MSDIAPPDPRDDLPTEEQLIRQDAVGDTIFNGLLSLAFFGGGIMHGYGLLPASISSASAFGSGIGFNWLDEKGDAQRDALRWLNAAWEEQQIKSTTVGPSFMEEANNLPLTIEESDYSVVDTTFAVSDSYRDLVPQEGRTNPSIIMRYRGPLTDANLISEDYQDLFSGYDSTRELAYSSPDFETFESVLPHPQANGYWNDFGTSQNGSNGYWNNPLADNKPLPYPNPPGTLSSTWEEFYDIYGPNGMLEAWGIQAASSEIEVHRLLPHPERNGMEIDAIPPFIDIDKDAYRREILLGTGIGIGDFSGTESKEAKLNVEAETSLAIADLEALRAEAERVQGTYEIEVLMSLTRLGGDPTMALPLGLIEEPPALETGSVQPSIIGGPDLTPDPPPNPRVGPIAGGPDPTQDRGGVIAFAGGGVVGSGGGLSLIGEEGPELLDLPAGSYIHNNMSTEGLLTDLGGSSGGPENHYHSTEIHINGIHDVQSLLRELRREMRYQGMDFVEVGRGGRLR